MLVLIKNNLNYLKGCIFECLFKDYNMLSFKKIFFSQHIMVESLSLED